MLMKVRGKRRMPSEDRRARCFQRNQPYMTHHWSQIVILMFSRY